MKIFTRCHAKTHDIIRRHFTKISLAPNTVRTKKLFHFFASHINPLQDRNASIGYTLLMPSLKIDEINAPISTLYYSNLYANNMLDMCPKSRKQPITDHLT